MEACAGACRSPRREDAWSTRVAAIRSFAMRGLLLTLLCNESWSPASAQRADENAVTSATDAFGTWNGLESVGLYSATDARGFSPKDAGNFRIDGLYFDYALADTNFDPCFVRQVTMRIGVAAQSFSFPSPTGIVDLAINTPGDTSGASAQFIRGPYATTFALVEGQGPLSEHLSGSICAGYIDNFLVDSARRAGTAILNAALRLRPMDGVEFKAFWNYDPGGAHGILPAVYADVLLPPPTYEASRLPSQPSTSWGWRQLNVGLMLNMTLPGDWLLNAGVFQSAEHDLSSFTEEFLSVSTDRQADHVLDVSPPTSVRSDSGELRLARDFAAAGVDRDLQVSIRGRDVDREYGGDALIDYGLVNIDAPFPPETAPFATGAVSLDAIRQFDFGVAYQERRPGVGSFGLGLLKSDYTRTIEAPGALPQTDRTNPWLLNLRFTADAGSKLTFYGSYVQGLEDSAEAPTDAANRREAPPATRTRQADAGIHYAPTGKLSIVFGAFEIDKAYFNLDDDDIYRELGRIRNRGLEGSVTYTEDGLTLLAGGVGLQPRVARSVPQPDATGDVPVGPVPLVLMVNLDYAPASWHSWAASMQWASYSSRVVTEDDRYSLPAFATLGAGVRYESKGHGHAWSLRLDGANLLGSEGLHVSTVGLLTPELGRRWILSFTIDS